MSTSIKFENISKQYRLGLVSTQTLSHDLNRWWAMNIRGKEDPYLKIGDTNDRAAKAESEYVWALRDINFEVQQGEVLGIIGKNGAGKSTLLKILSKVTAPTTGTIKARGRIASLLEVGTGFHPEMTGRENIYMNGAIMGMTKAEINRKLDEIIDFAGVERYIDTPVKRYSSGMTVRLGFAVAAHLEPEILVVDEVLAVGDAEFQNKAIGKMQDVSRKEGRTVLFVSHNMAAVRNLCNNGILLVDGQIGRTGKIDEIVDSYLSIGGDFNDISSVEVTEKHRLISVPKDLEIIKVERISNYEIDTTTPLDFKLTIRKNRDIKKAQCIGLIDDLSDGGARVGLFFSKEFDVPSEHETFTISAKLQNHNLTKSKYIMDFWIVIGDIISSVKYYDAVYDTVTFEVTQFQGEYINTWHNYWGKNCFTDLEISVD